ncbi:type II secretion system minor pseudopilin GspK [Halomonas denitrificans]|nr:type II secretion system minor pseudopilin GspK [Halomonas denitrificans]
MTGPRPCGKPTQRGAALLVALLAVALASVLALGLVEDQRRTLARTQALTETERSWQFAQGLESTLVERVRRARREGAGPMPLDGGWSAAFPVPGGAVRIRLIPRSDRFNLNSLADPTPERALRARDGLARLLAQLDLDPGLADALGDALRAGGRPVLLAHISELGEMDGFSTVDRTRLLPFVTVVPDPRSRLDVNAASAEALVAQVPELGSEAAERLILRAPYARPEDLFAQPELQALSAPDLANRLAVEGDWFLAHAEIALGDRVQDHYRLLNVSGAGYDARYVSLGIP